MTGSWSEKLREDPPTRKRSSTQGSPADSPMVLSAPQVFGDYELLERIAGGGMGVVYKARQVKLNRIVALKMLSDMFSASDEEMQRFQREAETAASLRHPHIVAIHEVGEVDGRPYFCMDYAPGGSLATFIGDHPLSARRAAEYVRQVGKAVAYAHWRNVLHRDLKPSNVLLDESHQPLVADFGLAKRIDVDGDLTSVGQGLGTPGYAPPEQARGDRQACGKQSDVYALGALLYALLTGGPPFRAATPHATTAQVLHNDPVSPRRINGGIDRDLDTICMKCLEKSPARRYASADEVIQDLDRYLADRPIKARPLHRAARLWRWARRKPAEAALGLMIILLVILVPGAVFYFQQQIAGERARHREQAWHNQLALERQKRMAADAQLKNGLLRTAQAESAARPLGWSVKSHTDLLQALKLDPRPAERKEIRDLLVNAWGAKDLEESRLSASLPGAGRVAFSPDGRWLALSCWRVRLWASVTLIDLETGAKTTLSFRASLGLQVFGDKRHPHDGVRSLAFSPGGRYLAAGTQGGRIYVWDVSTICQAGQKGKPTTSLPKPVSWTAFRHCKIWRLLFSRSGESLYACATLRGVGRWSMKKLLAGETQPAVVFQPKTTGADTDIALSPDGKLLATTIPGNNWLDADSLRPRKAPQHGLENYLRFHPHGRFLAGAAHGSMRLTTILQDGSHKEGFPPTSQRVLQDPNVKGARSFSGMDISPDGSLLAIGSQGELVVWELASRKVLARKAVGGDVVFPVFSDCGKRLAVTTESRVKLFTLHGANGRSIQQSAAHHWGEVVALDGAPDRAELACLARDRPSSLETAIWRLDSCGLPLTLPPLETGRTSASIAYRPGGEMICIGGENRLWFYHLQEMAQGMAQPKEQPADHPKAVQFAPNGGKLWVLDHHDGKPTVTARRPPHWIKCSSWRYVLGKYHGRHFRFVGLAVGGKWVLAATSVGNIVVLRNDDGAAQAIWQVGGGDTIPALALHPDESAAAVGLRNGRIEIRRFPLGELVDRLDFEGLGVQALVYSRCGGYLASGDKAGVVRLWRRADDHRWGRWIRLNHPGPISAIRFFDNDRRLAVLIEGETAVRIWRLDQLAQQLAELGLAAD